MTIKIKGIMTSIADVERQIEITPDDDMRGIRTQEALDQERQLEEILDKIGTTNDRQEEDTCRSKKARITAQVKETKERIRVLKRKVRESGIRSNQRWRYIRNMKKKSKSGAREYFNQQGYWRVAQASTGSNTAATGNVEKERRQSESRMVRQSVNYEFIVAHE